MAGDERPPEMPPEVPPKIPRGAQGRTPVDDWLLGSAEIMLGNEKGLARLDASASGFAASFWGLAIAALIDAFTLVLRYRLRFTGEEDAATTAWSLPGYVIASLAIALLAYAAGVLTLYLLARDPREQARLPLLIVAHNWAAPTVSLAVVPLAIALSSGLIVAGGSSGVIATVALLGILAVVGVRLIRIPLGIPFPKALGWFALSFLVGLVLSEWLENLFGL